jgi:4-alpha-glucanotransferase
MSAWIERSAGVLLHPTSLPDGGIGEDAARFAQGLAEAGVRVWQMLPVGAPDGHGSPYQPESAFAGHAGLFPPRDRARAAAGQRRFLDDNADWLPDYALFHALGRRFDGAPWPRWPAPLRDRQPAALVAARREFADEIEAVVREQAAFDHLWGAFKRRLEDLGLRIFGDVPLFLAHHSADVWAHRELFEVGEDGECLAYMGAPPDAFMADGQWWGYPPYRWDVIAASGFAWWKRRFEVQAKRFDYVRIDHFRGLCAFWRIPRTAATAREGAWAPGPGRAGIEVLQPVLGEARFVAEDLGLITPDVVAMREQVGVPGMRVLQFAFDGDPHNIHLPHLHGQDCVCYTGTHDNDTTLGWWREQDAATRRRVAGYLDQAEPDMPAALVDCAWASPAPLTVVPMQDLLGLGSEARMNRPGIAGGNWGWRFRWEEIPADLGDRLRADLGRHGRLPKA